MAQTKFKILIADDNDIIREGFKEIFLSAGYDVITAEDGAKAAQLTYSARPDIVLMDYHMPHKTGFEAVEEIRRHHSCANIPIIILTSDDERPVRMQGLSMEIDDFMLKPADEEEVLARVKLLLKRSLQRMDCNPLTKLPGNPSIQTRAEKEINGGGKFALIYADLNNFKAYNDVYGFKAGDNVLLTAAKIIESCALREDKDSFVGHIGGDDFVCICRFETADAITKNIVKNFDLAAPHFYNQQDAAQGFIITKDRRGEVCKFPLLSVSLAVVHNTLKQITNYAHASSIAAELKHYAKERPSSFIVFDKRTS